MNYYEHHLGDYMRDAAHLSMVEDGAYRRLIDQYYAREAPLPLDVKECQKLARCSSPADRKAVVYVLETFFRRCDDGYRHKRCDEEIGKTQARIQAARNNGQKGGRPKPSENPELTQEKPSGFPLGSIPLTQAKALHLPPPIHQTPEESAPRARVSIAAQMSVALRDLGVMITVDNPVLRQWTESYTVQQVIDSATLARQRKPHPEPIPAKYIDAILRAPQRAPPKSQLERLTWTPPPDEKIA